LGKIDVQLEHSTVEDKEYIKKLYQLYAHDLSEFVDAQLDSEGLFDDSFVDNYYDGGQLKSLKIKQQDRIIGFIFCSTGQTVDYVIQEFFVLRNYRRQGLARQALKQFFALYDGKIGFVVLKKNKPAQLFWGNIFKYYGINYTKDETTADGELCLKYIMDAKELFQSDRQK
jgi:predicted acetyltransferase